ncbi:hypothetical protein TNCV_3379651 [Trichonephila clavipes]|nr:hypothetical protein TNCV_3379651 [Trichonephila clavipes]
MPVGKRPLVAEQCDVKILSLTYSLAINSAVADLVYLITDTSDTWVENGMLRAYGTIDSGFSLRICTSSLYVVCYQPPLELRRMQSSANYFIHAMSVPSHPLKPIPLAIGLTRLYEARSFNIKPFSERAKAVLNDTPT